LTARNYRIPPGITVTVKARSRPALLSHCLGEEAKLEGDGSLVLDLAAPGDRKPRDLVSLDPASGTLTVRGVYKAIPWSCRASRRGDAGWTLEFDSPVLREYLALHVALLPVLRRVLLDSGVGLVAGAAFEHDGGATLLAGLTGHGKTTALLGALERGASFIGDEYLGLSGSADLTPVVRSLALRRATLALAPRALRRLGPGRRLALRIAELAALLTRGRLQPLVHVSPSALAVPTNSTNSDGGARVDRLFWLEVADGPATQCEPMDTQEAIRQLTLINGAHDLAYGDVGAFLEPGGTGHMGASYATRWRETIERGLRSVSCYRLSSPKGHDAAREVLEHVPGLGGRAGATLGN
jgi:hypothetical protein